MKRIYNEIASRYDTTPEEVEREIAYAISQARKNSSPTAKAFWARVKDDRDVADVICNIVSQLALVI